jgi:aryl-phospho-beta-D-glucosidase BglC (GH1 family)
MEQSMSCFFSVLMIVLLAVAAPAMEPLGVHGKDIVDSHGKVVSMRGTNFGGWLMMETWIPSLEMEWHDHLPRLAEEAGMGGAMKTAMDAIGEFNDDEERVQEYIARLHAELRKHAAPEALSRYLELQKKEPSVFAARDMDELLRTRFGEPAAGEIWNHYHDTWIAEADFQMAKALGFNFVRIPFWYRWFEMDDKPYEYHDYGFTYLDKAVLWAEKHGMYVMLDFHGAPGGQSPWDHTGELSRGEFFRNEGFQKRTAALWKHIATRYKDNPTVFSYDILNEPFSARGVEDWTTAHDLIYDAIREVDPDTIIIMEDGYKLESPEWAKTGFFPKPSDLGWNDVMYSFHFYSGADPLFTTNTGEVDHARRAREVLRLGRMEQERCNVPIYLGEFSTMGDSKNDIEGMRHFLTLFNQYGWHWSPWTWKYVNDDNEGSIWGVYQYAYPWTRTPNLYRDSEESIHEIIRRLTLNNFALHEDFGNVLRSCLVQPVESAEQAHPKKMRAARRDKETP